MELVIPLSNSVRIKKKTADLIRFIRGLIMGEKKNNRKAEEKYINFSDDKINVLLLGNSGCGKSTLINAFLGREEAETGAGFAVTKNIEVYESSELPFRMIDTVGFEYGLFKQYRIKRDLAKFSEDSVKNREAKKFIHVIWYCIAGTAKRIDIEALNYIKSVVSSWHGVPIIFVITKSYSEIEMEENKAIAHDAVVAYNAKHPRSPLNVKAIIPVVAKEYEISKDVIVSPTGLDTLLNKTNELAPVAKRVANDSIRKIDLKLKREKADFTVNASTVASIAVGAIPVPVPDSTILVPIQTKMIKDISKTYAQENDDISKDVRQYIIQIGATTIAGKAVVKALKQIPGLNIAASLIDAAAAGLITFAAGKTAEIVFEHFYTGEWDKSNFVIDSEVQQIFNDIMPDITEKLSEFLRDSVDGISVTDINNFFSNLLNKGK